MMVGKLSPMYFIKLVIMFPIDVIIAGRFFRTPFAKFVIIDMP